jgi:hypothetical protein
MFPSVKWMFFLAVAALFSLAASPALADADVIFSGGGIIRDDSGADAKRITFSVSLFADSGGTSAGQLQFHFHNLDDSYGLDRTRFTASDFDEVFFETRYFEDTPYTYVRIRARGDLNGGAGWSMMVRFADFGIPVRNVALPPNHADAVRIQLFDPAGVHVYDTGWAIENWREQVWRTLLDGGNVTVDMRLTTTP